MKNMILVALTFVAVLFTTTDGFSQTANLSQGTTVSAQQAQILNAIAELELQIQGLEIEIAQLEDLLTILKEEKEIELTLQQIAALQQEIQLLWEEIFELKAKL